MLGSFKYYKAFRYGENGGDFSVHCQLFLHQNLEGQSVLGKALSVTQARTTYKSTAAFTNDSYLQQLPQIQHRTLPLGNIIGTKTGTTTPEEDT